MAPAGELFDPRMPGFLNDPYPHFHRLRAAAPMHQASPGVWIASRYDDGQFVLSDARFG